MGSSAHKTVILLLVFVLRLYSVSAHRVCVCVCVCVCVRYVCASAFGGQKKTSDSLEL
jgi:hypothetical protein